MNEVASQQQLWMVFARRALVTVPAIVLLGFASASLSNSGDGNRWYAALDKPWFQPPAIAFPIAWTMLYVLLGLALAVILSARGAAARRLAVTLFLVQLAANLAWSPVFFGLHRMSAALVIAAAMIGLTIGTIIAFRRIRPSAALLMSPYLVWIVFAAMLNWSILQLNPAADGLVVDGHGTQIDIRR